MRSDHYEFNNTVLFIKLKREKKAHRNQHFANVHQTFDTTMFQELSSRCLTWNICILCSIGYIRTHNSNKSVNYTTKRSPRKWGRKKAAVPAGRLALHDYLPLSVSSVSLSASSLSLSSFESCWSVLPAIIPSFNSFFNHVGAYRKKKALTTFSITCPPPRSKKTQDFKLFFACITKLFS